MKKFNSVMKEVTGNEGEKCHYPVRMDTYGCGCFHDCGYCYSKSLLEFRNLWNPNNPSVADIDEIRKKIRHIKPGEIVRLGGMTDCFQPCELIHRNTYKTIKTLNKRRVGYLIVTKSHIVANPEYIAISVPELRIVKPKTYKEDTYRLASYIKEKKPEIDIHLLGGTEFEMLRRCKFCTSADSTSWATANRFGSIMGRRTNDLKKEKKEELHDHIKQMLIDMEIEPLENRVRDFTHSWISAYLHRQEYIRYAGSQD